MLKWDKRFLDLADFVAEWSKDSTKVGAVIVDTRNIVLGMGYNGFPRGIEDAEYIYDDRPLKYKYVVHAEVNAILNTFGKPLVGTIIYTNRFTCNECAKLIIQAGISKVVTYNYEDNTTWKESFELAKQFYKDANIQVVTYNR